MLALSSYSLDIETSIRSSLRMEFPLTGRWEGIFTDSVLSTKGSFIRFQWADWPDGLRDKLTARVEQFQSKHHLHKVCAGSPEWNEIFGGSAADREAANRIGGIFGKFFRPQPLSVRSERDSKGTITASVGIGGTTRVDLRLTWNGCTIGGIGPEVGLPYLHAAIRELQEWAGSRIKPILKALEEKLSALYGDRFCGLYVFGSYARPDAGIELSDESDLDVALILSDFQSPYQEISRFGRITSQLSLERGIVISLVPIREKDFAEGKTNFIRVISEEAVRVA